MELNLPVDFERLPEFRMLGLELTQRRSGPDWPEAKAQVSGKEIEALAVFVWMRLWVELAYLAQTTDRPGWLTPDGGQMFERTLEPMFGEECRPVEVLEKAGVLKRVERGSVGAGTLNAGHANHADDDQEGWLCERFARLNGHLAGNHVPRERKGAAVSAFERGKNRIAHEADQQAMLLAATVFKKPDGSSMNDTEVRKAMIVIKTLDNYLRGATVRKQGEYTDGLIADAHAAAARYSPETLKGFYVWLDLHRGHPAVAKTTEGALARFEELVSLSKG